MRGILIMVCRLASGVQVRKESWGLLFYTSARHKIRFVRSGDLLYPRHFDGTWTLENIVDDAARRSGNSVRNIQTSLLKLTRYLLDSELIADESR